MAMTDHVTEIEILKTLSGLRRKDRGDIYITDLKPLIDKHAQDHRLALRLWATGDMAAREQAVRIADPAQLNKDMAEAWLSDLDEWGLTDAFASLIKETGYAVPRAEAWAQREPEFEKRAGFSLMAQLAWTKNDLEDHVFTGFLQHIEKGASDERLYVKKAVNWALRDIAKRNDHLRQQVCGVAERLRLSDDKTVRWVATHRDNEFRSSRQRT